MVDVNFQVIHWHNRCFDKLHNYATRTSGVPKILINLNMSLLSKLRA